MLWSFCFQPFFSVCFILESFYYCALYSLFIWLHWVLVVACGTFCFSCGMQALSCGMWDLVLPPGIDPGPPALGAWSLSHWTTREISALLLSSLVVSYLLLITSSMFFTADIIFLYLLFFKFYSILLFKVLTLLFRFLNIWNI